MKATKVIPISNWPEYDQRSWNIALAGGDIFDNQGPGAHWSAGSRRSIATGYGRWIGYLRQTRSNSLALDPADRLTPDRFRQYVEYLQPNLTTAGLFNYVKHLYDAIRVMAPECDWRWLKEAVWKLASRVERPWKRPRMVDADRLLCLGLDLMDKASRVSAERPLNRAVRYRDGLIIALLAARPLRRRNLTAIRIGRNLLKVGDTYVLVFAANETKNHQSLEFSIPEIIAPYLNRYLADVRCCFPQANRHDGLWASAKGRPMTPEAIYERVCLRTREEFGHTINPHLFRDCAATTIAIRDPKHVMVARDLLGHSRLDMTERYYNQAQAIEVSRQYQQTVLALRRESEQNG